MDIFSYKLADDLDNAWLNFELDLPLKPLTDGSPNPFYTNRPGDTLNRLYAELLSPFYAPPKIFLAGHRGTGKSTELIHLSSHMDIRKKFWPIYFSIREDTDIIDIDFQDLLLGIGSRLYREYKNSGGKIPSKLLDKLETWRGKIEIEIQRAQGKITETEISGGIDTFFANAGLKMKLEPHTRKTIRQIIKPISQELIDLINEISSVIYAREHRIPLLIIDDLDKPDINRQRDIFGKNIDALLSPNCAIIYVVSQALFYSNQFDAIRDRSYYLPAVDINTEKKSGKKYMLGYQMFESMISKRIDLGLINDKAADMAIRNSGGVVRELNRLIRSGIGRARRAGREFVSVDDILLSSKEIAAEYSRILDEDDLLELESVKFGKFRWSERTMRLLLILAILEYVDDDGRVWHSIHPSLNEIIPQNNTSESGTG